MSRGVAVAYGKVYVAQVDGHVVALDAKTGKVVWKTRREDILPQPYHWYTFTGAPQVYNGLVVVGNGGAEWPTRGFMAGLRGAAPASCPVSCCGERGWRTRLSAKAEYALRVRPGCQGVQAERSVGGTPDAFDDVPGRSNRYPGPAVM